LPRPLAAQEVPRLILLSALSLNTAFHASSFPTSFSASTLPALALTQGARLAGNTGLALGLRTQGRPNRKAREAAAAAAAAPALTRSGLALKPVVLLVLFVLVDTGQALAMDWAENRGWDPKRGGKRQYARQSILVFHSAIAIVTGLLMAGGIGGVAALRECLSPRLFLRFLPVSLCFATGLSLKMMAVDHFQAGTIKIVGQLRLPMLALASTFLLGRYYSAVKWQVIGMITSSCIAFVMIKGQGRTAKGMSWKWAGLSQLLAWVVLNVIGGIVAERAYKIDTLPFYAQKVAEDIGHLLVTTVMLYGVVPRFDPGENVLDRTQRPGGFFDAWDFRTVVAVAFLFADAWIGNLLLKEFSSVTRSIAKAFAISVVYFCSFVYSADRRANPALTLVAMLVIQSSVLFTFV